LALVGDDDSASAEVLDILHQRVSKRGWRCRRWHKRLAIVLLVLVVQTIKLLQFLLLVLLQLIHILTNKFYDY
jgi:hypothetical protein